MGFKALKKDIDDFMVSPEVRDMDDGLYRYLMVRCLFEIAGNLDTIAVCQREIVNKLKEHDQEMR